jgi:hypothetical protein
MITATPKVDYAFALAERGVDVVVVERSPSWQVSTALANALEAECRVQVEPGVVADPLVGACAALHLQAPEVIADMVRVVEDFLACFRLTTANVRVEIVTKRMCPKLHCDNVHVRLVTTYCGLGTEYTIDAGPVLQAPPGSLVFLKGYRHPTHMNRVRHRSPDVPTGQRRLSLAVDY